MIKRLLLVAPLVCVLASCEALDGQGLEVPWTGKDGATPGNRVEIRAIPP